MTCADIGTMAKPVSQKLNKSIIETGTIVWPKINAHKFVDENIYNNHSKSRLHVHRYIGNIEISKM